jgi:transketolase
VEAYRGALLAAADAAPAMSVVESGLPPDVASSPFAARFPDRYVLVERSRTVAAVVDRCRRGGPVFVGAPVPSLLEEAYPELVRSLVAPRANAKMVGFPAVGSPSNPPPPAAVRNDLGAMRSLPAMTVVAPADAATVRTAIGVLAERLGPAYLRLPPPDAPSVTDGTFVLGRAHELRSGSDLAVVTLGTMVHRSLQVAEELARVGLSVRVLDAASVKPFDEAAVLRAARDTGAILVVEAAPLGTGLGTLVAAMTAENAPVPVRRLGLPDLWPGSGGSVETDEPGLSLERIRDEAFELLRVRGRIA